MRKRVTNCILCVLAVMCAAPGGVHARMPADTSSVQFLPTHRLFPRLLANGTAHQLGVAKDLHSRRWFGAIGAQRPLVQLTTGSFDLQAGIGATVHTGFLRNPPLLQVVTVDFAIDFPVDIRISPSLTLRTGYGHHSAHLADDGIEQLGIHSVNYAKDYVMLLSAYALPGIGGFVYGGGRFDFHTLPETKKHWVVQCGCEAGNIAVLPWLSLYAALDFRFREEIAFRSTQSYQIGAKLFERSAGTVRVTYTYRTGADDRGQYYRETADLSLLSVYVDF